MTNTGPIINTKLGQIRGKEEINEDGSKFYSFQGIPFAKPPLGPLRFKSPQPAEPWIGIRDATKESTPCFQRDIVFADKIKGDEDCLYLNVYTPELPQKGSGPLKAVMFYIHGGASVIGSNSRDTYSPEYLLQHDIVLVATNYRLGALGFLSLEDQSLGVPGNAAFRDQTMALKWVQENIEQFGGDSGNVTIFGHSVGALSVHLHVLSRMSKGLFHRAIMQSGCALGTWAVAKKFGYEIVDALGKQARNDKEVLEILQSVTKEELLDAQWKIGEVFNASVQWALSGTIEGDNPYEPVFLPDHPKNLIKSGNFNKVPIILGYTSQELIAMELISTMFSKDLKDSIPYTLNILDKPEKVEKVIQKMKEFYFEKNELQLSPQDATSKLISDTMFISPIYETIALTLSQSQEAMFVYQFSVDASRNCIKFELPTEFSSRKGAAHGDEFGYLWKVPILPPPKKASIEEISIKRMTTWWTNFAKYGNPNATNKEQEILLQTNWPKLAKDDIKCLDIAEEITVLNDPERKVLNFWKSLEEL